ncbi:MAG: PepSY domain-containing protein [Sphingomonadaceae bacterium]
MRIFTASFIPAALAIAWLTFAPAHAADRAPTPDERTSIEKVLRENGFVSWEDIELDDGWWEVDNALMSDKVVYDLKINPATMQIEKRDRED